jgi:hypothetical protein
LQAYASGRFATNGDAQTSLFVLRRLTTSSVERELFLDGSNARMVLSTGSTWTFDALVSGRSDTGNSAGYKFTGVIENVSGTVALVGSVLKTTVGEDVGNWDANMVADDANNALVINVVGATNSPVRWVSYVRTAEVRY